MRRLRPRVSVNWAAVLNGCLRTVAMGPALGPVEYPVSVLAFWEQCLPITIVFQSESGSFPTVPGENDLEIHRKALN